jgi:hypothetical protein
MDQITSISALGRSLHDYEPNAGLYVSSGEQGILATKGYLTEHPLYLTCHIKHLLRNIQEILHGRCFKPSEQKQRTRLLSCEKFSIHIDWASPHNCPGDGIQRIVFDDATQSAWSQDTPDFSA